jgi:hypothetical protein
MTTYTPDKFVVHDYGASYEEERYAILGGWWGNFITPDSWKRSSPIVRWELQDDSTIIAHTYSGSQYRLTKELEGVTMLTQSLIIQASLAVIDEWEEIMKIAKENSDV